MQQPDGHNTRPIATHLMMTGEAVSGISSLQNSTPLIIFEKDAKLVKRFRLHELPPIFIERTLAPHRERVAKLFSSGYTLRVVRHDKNYGYVFNGRTGHTRKGDEAGKDELLKLPEFETLNDERDLSEIDASRPAKKWDFEGAPVTVEQWMRGMGKTQQVGPGEPPEQIPKDAKRYLANTCEKASGQLGRARIPKGRSMLPKEEDESSSEEDSVPAVSHRDAFNALLAGNAASNESSEASVREADPESSDSAEGSPVKSFAQLLAQNQERKPRMTDEMFGWNALRPPSRNASDTTPKVVLGRSTSENYQRASETPDTGLGGGAHLSIEALEPASSTVEISGAEEEQPRNATEAFPSYGNRFAKVDDIGLTANAGNIAQWNDQHHKDQKRKKKALPVTSRDSSHPLSANSPVPTEDALSSAAASSTGRKAGRQNGANAGSSGALYRQSRKTGAHIYKPPEAPASAWANKNVGLPSRKLVDDTSAMSTGRAPVPPGLHPGTSSRYSQKAPQTPLIQQTGDLIDLIGNPLEEQIATTPHSAAKPNMRQVLTPDALPEQSRLDNDDDEIVERVRALPSDYAIKRNTMRQKAGKKANKVKSAGNAKIGAATLPLPDPPPLPKPNKVEPPRLTGIQKHLMNVQASRKSDLKEIASAAPAEPILSPTQLAFHSISNASHAFGQLIQQEIKRAEDKSDTDSDDEDLSPPPKLIAHVGTLLALHGSKEIARTGVAIKDVQNQLVKAAEMMRTEFSCRLTTSIEDASYLFKLACPGEAVAKTAAYHELFVKDTGGRRLKLTVYSGAEKTYSIENQGQDELVQEAYTHYPVHVWDARFRLFQPQGTAETPAAKALAKFVQSLKTDEEVPSIRGMISDGLFTVHKAYAKQMFTHQDQDGVTFRLTRMQDLYLEVLDDPYHNFQAVVEEDKVMLEQQRVWWEASWETENLLCADALQAKVDYVVRNMDSVGMENQGPLVAASTTAVQEEDVDSDPDAWYW